MQCCDLHERNLGAFSKYNKIIYSSAAPALSKAAEFAAANGKPYSKTITTTPNILDSPEGAFCKAQIDGACKFTELFYDWKRPRIQEYIAKNSRNDFVHVEFSYRELGLSEEWFRKECRNLENDMGAIKREILLEWCHVNDTSPFSEESMAAIDAKLREPTGKLVVNDFYVFDLYETLNPMTPYVVGVDVAGGLDLDSSSATIIDPFSFATVGHFKSNKIDTRDLSDMLERLVKVLPNCILAPERNSLGKGVIDNLLAGPAAKNVYWEVREVKAEKKVMDGRVVRSAAKRRVYGVSTDSASRDLMINEILFTLVASEHDKVVCRAIFQDIKDLVRNKKGKIEHRAGAHDDSLFSYLIGRYVINFGSNLKHYNISRTPDANRKAVASKASNLLDRIAVRNSPSAGQSRLLEEMIERQLDAKMREAERKGAGKASSLLLSILAANSPSRGADE